MAEILFYHLTRRPLEAAVPGLLEKCLERGWKVVLRAGSRERAEALNRHLWTYREDGFLPHGGPEDGEGPRQPVYLTAGTETPNSPDVLMLVDGAEATAAEVGDYIRALLLFDGHDEAALAAARAAWKTMTAAGLKAIYWAETDAGGWTKKAEAGG
ncbi:DNA polymerase III subunit chi [Pikeienuella piscinae]|uniref:DNA polymerase III subunit chi n=1 Tax=Pikeienuella piscinae TaxID=2748098 RepID=A0A7L5BUY2_9RHOB|nr:DNA polymerase III subunit chi [Pikeienuella piscinae]QIE54863.1 DNA polymerase III subunit chi [Pikeienuella piscinae]